MDEIQTLELLEFYVELTEKQDEAISKLSSLVVKQATELAHLRNFLRTGDGGGKLDPTEAAKEIVREYKNAKMEP